MLLGWSLVPHPWLGEIQQESGTLKTKIDETLLNVNNIAKHA